MIITSAHSPNGVDYALTFEDVTNEYAPVLGGYYIKLIEFGFFPLQKVARDPGIGPIIAGELRREMNDPNKVISYVCDEIDGKQQKRRILFNRWMDQYMDDFVFQEINPTITTDHGILKPYIGLIMRQDFEHEAALVYHVTQSAPGVIRNKNRPYPPAGY